MNDLVEFLRARYAERRALAERMREAIWPDEVYVLPKDTAGDYLPDEPRAHLTVGPQYTKAYATVWESQGPQAGPLVVDDSWHVHSASVEVWSERVAEEILADVDAKLRVVDECAKAIEAELPEDGAWFAHRVLRVLASAFAAHQDYRPEWAPSGDEVTEP